MYYPCSENKCRDQFHSYCEADLHLFSHMQSVVFSDVMVLFFKEYNLCMIRFYVTYDDLCEIQCNNIKTN